jgi:hypothetical protein
MKKTLIALAVVAVSGTAFAQSSVSLTGKLRFAYGTAKATTGVKTTGVGVTDGDWNIAAVEDLGGGLKAGANMALRLRGRDAATDGTSTGVGARPRDSSMYLTGGFGTVLVGAIEAGNGLLPLVTAGGPNYIGLDNGAQLAAAGNVDILQYTSPSFSGFSVKAATLDTVGGNGSQTGGYINLIGANYANGPLSAALDFTGYGSASTTTDSRTRISANYDLGMARVGAGFQTAKSVASLDKNETAVSVSVPVGAFNIGGIYASSKTEGTAGTNTGFDLAVQYNLSKRTYVAFQAQSTKAAGASASATAQRVQLSHSF